MGEKFEEKRKGRDFGTMGLRDDETRGLARIFHTPARRVRARGLQCRTLSFVGRVPSPGGLTPIQDQYEKCGLGAVDPRYTLKRELQLKQKAEIGNHVESYNVESYS